MDTAIECPTCMVPIETTHRVYASPGGRTKRGECPKCLKIYTIVEIIAIESPLRGQGAHALAKKMAEGEVVVTVGPPAPSAG